MTLLVLSALVMIVLALTLETKTSQNIALNQGSDLKNVYACQGALALARKALIDDFNADREKQNPWDALTDRWAEPKELTLGETKLNFVIVDEERKFNINCLATDNKRALKIACEQFRRLISFFEPEDEHLADKIIDYIDIDEKGDYETSHARNEAIDSLDELFVIEGMTDQLMDGVPGDPENPGLADVLTTISSGKVNINTAHPFVLRCLDSRMTKDVVDEIVNYREEHPFKSVQELAKAAGADVPIGPKILQTCTTRSSFFLLKAEATTQEITKHVRALLFRDENGRVVVLRWDERRW